MAGRILCEICEEREATYLEYTGQKGWRFTCNHCDNEWISYDIQLSQLHRKDWLDHLSRKSWFADTAGDFIKRRNKYEDYLFNRNTDWIFANENTT